MDVDRERKYLETCSNVEACRYLGTKVRQWRRAERLSQAELAARAEVPLRTYKRFETHGKANLETFIQVLGALGRTPYLFMLFPTSPPKTVSVEEKLRHLGPTQFRL